MVFFVWVMGLGDVVPVAEIFVTNDSLIECDNVVRAYTNNKQKNTIPHKRIIQRKPKTQKLQLLRILIQRNLFFIYLLKTTTTNSSIYTFRRKSNFRGKFMFFSEIPIWVEELLSYVVLVLGLMGLGMGLVGELWGD